MQTAFRTTAKVLEGGKVEIFAPQLPANVYIEVILALPAPSELSSESVKRSALDILKEMPGQRIFHTADQVNNYPSEERNAWDS